MKFSKVLIANRGEIACRLIQGCQALGIKAVAVHSDADATSRAVKLADEAINIGPGPAVESYLVIDKIIDAAKKSGAQAIHPGYGFLSERSAFANAVKKAGLVFIGPSGDVIEAMGNKIAAKRAAEKAKVPTLPWGLIEEDESSPKFAAALKKIASKVGYPLLLKAAAGGGGRGMRLVTSEDKLEESARSAAREALAAFGSGELFIESYREAARHVEVQILGDTHGQVFSFGERDCTAQRRHQKVIEEAPAPKLSDKTRKALWAAAVALGKSVGYVNAGTCEFLVDGKEGFYFLEMNTRLQVEHPVTELVWGVDLVELQLKVAQGEKLPAELGSLVPCGHAMEARVYAEDPAKQFMPSPGKITTLSFPMHPRVRIDAGYEAGGEVPLFYDAMIAKVIAWGTDRDQARANLVAALEDIRIGGVKWNGEFLRDIVQHQDFANFGIDTKWIEREFKAWKPSGRFAVLEETTEPSEAPMSTPQRISPWFYYGTGGGTLAKGKAGKRAAHHDHAHAEADGGPLIAEHPGKVLAVKVKPGQSVSIGDVLVVCESMKMEFSYSASRSGTVKAVLVQEGQVVPAGTVLVEWNDDGSSSK